MEIREVKVKQVDQKCPVCGNGWMRPNGIVSGNPQSPQFEHKCSSCNYKQFYPIKYPYIVNE